MAWETNDTHLGVSMTGSKLRVVEAELVKGQLNLVNVAEIQLDIPFDFYVIGNDDFVSKFSDAINNAVESLGIRASSAAFALERRMVLLKKLLADRNFGPQELKRHIEWEAEQFIVSARSEYNIAFEKLGFFKNHLEEVAVVAVRKAIVLYLKEIFYRTSLNLKILDVDLFAAIRALIKGIQSIESGSAALIDYCERGVELCVIRNGKYYTSTEVTPTRENSGLTRFTEVSDGEMAKIVFDELQKLISISGLEIGIDDLETIFVAGDHVSADFISELERLQTVKVQIANPFKGLQLSLDSASEMEIQEHPERFLAGVGLVAREDAY
jgi:Tfp pilus assembly PilM family ATPase